MKVRRTEQTWLRTNKQLSSLCHISKNLYNEANYIIRQEFIENRKWTRDSELNRILRESESVVQLPAQTGQQILRQLDKNWLAFFKAVKLWKKDKNKFFDKPGLPKYKKKDGEHMLIFTNQQCKIKNGIIQFPKKCNLDIEVKTRIKQEDMQQIRIVPKGYGYVLEIAYWKHINPEKLSKERRLNIDFGLKNLVTLTNNIGEQPIVIKGNIPKSINQYFNKKYARILHQFDIQGIKDSKRFYRLINKRNRKIKNFFHVVTKYIIDYCKKNNIGVVVIGNNLGQKQKIKIGKIQNQHFVSIAFYSVNTAVTIQRRRSRY